MRPSSLRLFLCVVVFLVFLPLPTIGYGAAYSVYEEHHCQRCAEGCFDSLGKCRHTKEMAVQHAVELCSKNCSESLAQCRRSREIAIERAVEERCAPREMWWQEVISTVEVLVRGFCLGFGSRVMMFLFSSRVDSPSQQLSQMRDLVQVAIMTGLSTSCILFGASIFLPMGQRLAWLQF